jgi:hypothetical protein
MPEDADLEERFVKEHMDIINSTSPSSLHTVADKKFWSSTFKFLTGPTTLGRLTLVVVILVTAGLLYLTYVNTKRFTKSEWMGLAACCFILVSCVCGMMYL